MTGNETCASICDLIDQVQSSLNRCWRSVTEAQGHFMEAQDRARELRRRIESLEEWHVCSDALATRRVQKDYVADVVKTLAAIGHPVNSDELLSEYLKTHRSKKPFSRNVKRAIKEERIVKLEDGRLALPAHLQHVADVSQNFNTDA